MVNKSSLVKDINPGLRDSHPRNLTNLNGTLYFRATNDNDSGLWKSDGTTEGTVLVKDINITSYDIYYSNNINDTIYFGAYDSTNGCKSILPKRL